MEYRDYYATLGVPRTASQADIKKAFRKLARQHHPDANKGNAGAEGRFKEINEANEVLSDPAKRKLYDQLGSNWQAYQQAGATGGAGGPGGNPFADFGGFGGAAPGGGAPGGVRFEYRGNAEDLAGFSDFFRTFFGGGSEAEGRSGRTRTQTRTRGGTSIDDLLAGLGQQPAGASNNRAAVPARLEAHAELTLEEVASGTKRLLDVDGKRIEVTIPQGVADRQSIRFSGVAAGADAYVKVSVAPHPVFTRDGANLTREVPITLREALLGGETAIKTLTGKVMLRIPPETQTGRTFRLAGQGLPHFRKEGRGDLFVKVRVVLPTDLSAEAKQAAQAFLDLAEGHKK
ncbi:MAG: curved DNA-binding protein [Chloroflexota bacterium]|jgi:DnaJ-class molecular chaperone|nr:curved DNA-binding protein [Chloroflexota bacterium]